MSCCTIFEQFIEIRVEKRDFMDELTPYQIVAVQQKIMSMMQVADPRVQYLQNRVSEIVADLCAHNMFNQDGSISDRQWNEWLTQYYPAWVFQKGRLAPSNNANQSSTYPAEVQGKINQVSQQANLSWTQTSHNSLFRKRDFWVGFALGAVTAAIVALIVVIFANMTGSTANNALPEESNLSSVYERCSSVSSRIKLSNDKKSITIEESQYSSLEALECIADATSMSDATLSNIEQTTGLDGRQSAEWGPYKASWSFNANCKSNAFQLVLEIK